VFSVSATKIASRATEGAIRIGGIASQKVSDISATVGEKVSMLLFFSFTFIFFIPRACVVHIYVCSFKI
jgi:hypothetical protein